MVNVNTIKKGDIVYVISGAFSDNTKKHIRYAIIDEVYSDGVYVDFLEENDCRYVEFEGKKMHIDDLINDSKELNKKRKLPKGWSYDTKLVKTTFERSEKEKHMLNIPLSDKEAILNLYNKKILVESCLIFDGYVNTHIDKDGWNIVLEYNGRYGIHSKITHGCYTPDKLYDNYSDAKKALDDEIAEMERIVNLSDEEWSKEQMNKTLNHYKQVSGVDDDTIESFRGYLFEKKNVEDVEIRIHDGKIQWKYWYKRRWYDLSLDMI